MRVLITDGAGYIGSHTAKALARAGNEPVVYDNLLDSGLVLLFIGLSQQYTFGRRVASLRARPIGLAAGSST